MIQVREYKPKIKYNIRKNLESKRYSVQFLPESLNQESLNKNFTFNTQKLKTAYLVDIIHNLILKYYFKKENSFNISSIVLKEKYGHKYNYYIDYLVNKGTLKLIKKHQKGKNARIYKLDENVINGKITRYKNEALKQEFRLFGTPNLKPLIAAVSNQSTKFYIYPPSHPPT